MDNRIILQTFEKDGVRYDLVVDAIAPAAVSNAAGSFEQTPKVIATKAKTDE